MCDLERYERALRAQGFTAETIRARVGAVARVARAAGVEPAGLSAEHVVDYLAERPLAAWSRRKYLEHLREWAAWAGLADPTVGLRRPPQPRGVPRPVSEPDLAVLLAAATPRERAYLVLGAFAGLRSFETAKVRGDDLTLASGGPLLRVQGKGGHVDQLPASFVVVRELQAWRDAAGDGRLWPRASADSVQAAVRRVGQRAGVKVSSHQLRHRYGTQLYAASRDLLLTQRLMRHANVNTTAGYARVSDLDAARLVEQLRLPLTSVADVG